jgi:putative nucleotidyltransferase with HDIG domain
MKVLALGVCLLAGVLAMKFLTFGLPGGHVPVLLLVGLVLITENFAFSLPLSGSVSLSFAAAFAAMLHSGPLAAMVVSIAASTNLAEARAGKPVVIRLFNAGQLVVSAGLSGSVFLWTGGAPLSQAPATVSTTLVPAIASALVFYVSNVLLVSLAVGLMTNQPYGRVLGQLGFLSYGSSLLVLALLGLLIAHLLSIQSWASLLLLTLPFMAARRTFRVYVELTEAYASTVRSLVTAIEAKDPYTRGHSERVAEYAQAIAEQMGLPQPDVQMLERAALLHDVGKIGISLDTLVSPDELSEDEMRAIRRHPGLGADLIADVDFLHDIVDVVRCHHERCDGGGYPDGILGEDIPLLARILAAADSFDAMTSDRAYRPGMPFEQAIEELRRVAGEQLDERVVASFVEVLRSDELGAMAP